MTRKQLERYHATVAQATVKRSASLRHTQVEHVERCWQHKCLSQAHINELRQSAIQSEGIQLLGYYTGRRGQLVLPYLRPNGQPEESKQGTPFLRWKPQPAAQRKVAGFKHTPKYLSPRGCGNRLYHSHIAIQTGRYFERLADINVPLVITEGEKKAEALTIHWPKAITIGLSGVWNWRDRRGDGNESAPLPELEDLPVQGREIFLLFDSDAALNSKVLAALQALAEYLIERGAHIQIIRLPSELDGQKNGVDDLIYRHGSAALKTLVGIAQPAFRIKKKEGREVYVFHFPRDPEESHFKAVLAAAVLGRDYKIRPGIGVMHWEGSHWVQLPGKETKVMGPVLHQFMDSQGWQKRSLGVQNAVLQELVDRILVQEENWANGGLSNFANGTYEQASGRLRDHRRRDYLVGCLPYDFAPNATCQRWEGFISEACGGDAAVMTLVQAVFRYVLEPKDRLTPFPLEKCFDFEGRKGTGKGTCVETLMALVGENLVGPGGPKTFCDDRSLAALVGKLMACDTDAAGHLSDAGLLNKVISNEAVLVRFLYQEQRMIRLGVVLVRAYNDSPTVAGGGVEGLDRRIVVIPFRHRPEHPDPNLKAALRAELPGIWQWAHRLPIEEAIRVIRHAGSIEAIAQSSVERHLDNNPVTRFVIETFPQGISEIGGRQLYRTWCNWCEDTGHQAGSETLFGRRIKKLTDLVSVRKQHTRVTYAIEAAAQFDLAAHLGVKPNSLTDQRVAPKPSAPKSPATTEGTEGSDSSGGFSKTIHLQSLGNEKPEQKQVAPKPSEPSDFAKTDCAANDPSQRDEQRVSEALSPDHPATAAEWVELAKANLLAAKQDVDAGAIHQWLLARDAGVSRSQVDTHCRDLAAPPLENMLNQMTLFPCEHT